MHIFVVNNVGDIIERNSISVLNIDNFLKHLKNMSFKEVKSMDENTFIKQEQSMLCTDKYKIQHK